PQRLALPAHPIHDSLHRHTMPHGRLSCIVDAGCGAQRAMRSLRSPRATAAREMRRPGHLTTASHAPGRGGRRNRRKAHMNEADWPSRRRLLATGGGVLTTAVLAACGNDTSDRYDTGYISGEGVSTEISAADRDEPLKFSGTTYEGEEFAAAEQRGQLLVVNVWYAACPPCRKEAPDLQEISQDYGEQGVSFIGINVRDEAGPALAFEENYGITYPSLPDLDAEIMYALRGQVAPNAVPTTLLMDRAGRVAARVSGAIDPSTLRSMIDRVLAECTSPRSERPSRPPHCPDRCCWPWPSPPRRAWWPSCP